MHMQIDAKGFSHFSVVMKNFEFPCPQGLICPCFLTDRVFFAKQLKHPCVGQSSLIRCTKFTQCLLVSPGSVKPLFHLIFIVHLQIHSWGMGGWKIDLSLLSNRSVLELSISLQVIYSFSTQDILGFFFFLFVCLENILSGLP